MYRSLIVIALFATPVFAAGQTPSPAASTHPAASAHANAVAGHTGAALIETCGRVAHDFLDELEKGNVKTATSYFNPRMQAAVSEDKLATTWKSLGAQFGKLESRGKAQTVMYQQMPVVTTPLHFTRGDFISQLACDADGKIAGFYIRPMQPEAAPAASAQ